MTPDPIALGLIDRWQRDFPLVERPFVEVGHSFGLDERRTIDMLCELQASGVISRVGAVVKPNTVGASTLAAMQLPSGHLDEVAEIVSQAPLVTHNYERSHPLNLWFVVAGPDGASVDATIRTIERRSGFAVLNLPMQHAYHLDLGFPLRAIQPKCRRAAGEVSYRPDPRDQRILAAIEDGLPLVEEPYHAIAGRLGLRAGDVIERLEALTTTGVVTRLGCVLHHRTLGYQANAMAVWDIEDGQVDRVAAAFIENRNVTLCYRRPRRPPAWRYNLFCMVHARSRSEVDAVVRDLNRRARTGSRAQAVLFSLRKFKQRGAVFSQRAEVLQ